MATIPFQPIGVHAGLNEAPIKQEGFKLEELLMTYTQALSEAACGLILTSYVLLFLTQFAANLAAKSFLASEP